MASALSRAGMPAVRIPIMVAIGLAESGGRLTVQHKNSDGSIDTGPWQVNSVHGFNTAQLMTLDGNARATVQVYNSQGLNAWSTYKSGAYLSHMSSTGNLNLKLPPGVGTGIGIAGGVVGLPSVSNPIGGAISGVEAAAGFVAKAGSVITSVDFWRRVGYGGLALVLLIAAIALYARTFVTSNAGKIVKDVLK